MRTHRFLSLMGAAVLVMAPAAWAKELKAGPLFALCAAKANQKAAFGCEAFTEGFVQGVVSTGAICPPPDAYREVIADLLTLPRSVIGDGTVAQVLLPRLKAKYPCRAT